MGDIERLKTRGFRREALSSLCQVAYLTIVSRTEAELAATKTSCAGMPGITVTADNLFCRLPVRRNYYKSANRRKEEHDKSCVWSSPEGGQHMLDSVALVIGRRESTVWRSLLNILTLSLDICSKKRQSSISGPRRIGSPGGRPSQPWSRPPQWPGSGPSTRCLLSPRARAVTQATPGLGQRLSSRPAPISLATPRRTRTRTRVSVMSSHYSASEILFKCCDIS